MKIPKETINDDPSLVLREKQECGKEFVRNGYNWICGKGMKWANLEDINKPLCNDCQKQKTTGKIIEPTFKLVIMKEQNNVKHAIKFCEGKHIQQVAYSSCHDALTQTCFTCKKIRTNMKEEDLK